MLIKLSFQKKLFLSLSLILIVLIAILSTAFYRYSSSMVTTTEQNTTAQIAGKISDQIDELYKQMDIAATSIVNNVEIQNIVYELNFNEAVDSAAMIDYDATIRRNLQVINFYLRNVIKTTIFNSKKGFYFYTGLVDDDPEFAKKRLMDITWYDSLVSETDPVLMVPPHQNVWSESPKTVLSLYRRFTNPGDSDFGLFEIQMPYSVLEKVCSLDGIFGNDQILIFDREGDLVFPFNAQVPAFGGNTADQIYKTAKEAAAGSGFVENPGNNLFFSYIKSNYTGFTLVLADKQNLLGKQLSYYRTLTLSFGVIILLVILIVFYILTSSLTRPLKRLIKTIEKVNLDNMRLNMPHDGSNEFTVLDESFNSMFTKLKGSINELYESKIRESKAHFLALQSQMNPHFLFNTLNVIEASSEEHNDHLTARMCNRLSEMTRYIISTSNPVVTLRDEINHTANYLELMKKHYEEFIEYEIDIPGDMHGIFLPKITLQPLVENSVNHGFEKTPPPWRLTVRGVITGNGGWEIIIEDNGSGMREEALSELSNQLRDYSKNLREGNLRENLSLGGMGVLNTYARFAIYFKENAFFALGNREPHGFIVRFGCQPPL